MQWPSFFEGWLITNAARGEYVPIPRSYGFLWLFIAGVPWAGIGACLLAWCGSRRETRVWHWVNRIACGLGGAALARYLFTAYPQFFLPLYESLESRYHDLGANPSLRRLINDCGAALSHMGCYVGFLLYEAGRKEGQNVLLILTVGVVNGAGWALCQNWKWAPGFWQGSNFNFWRCWESSGGISIGIAYGLAYYLVNREMADRERAMLASRRSIAGPNFEWLLVYFGLSWLLSLFLRPALGGWGSLYFSVVILFGAAYYLRNRRTVVNGSGADPREAEAGSRIEWGTVCLTLALIAGLFLPGRQAERYGVVGSGVALALGFAWYLSKRETFDEEARIANPASGDPSLERLGLYLGVLTGLGLSIRNGLKGWFNIYLGDEDYWGRRLWEILGPAYLACLLAIVLWNLIRARNPGARCFPRAYPLIWLVLIVQNVIAQLVTGPLTQWNEAAFSIYYLLLFLLCPTIVFHFHAMRERMT
jgi:hypothetical protein